MKVAGTILMRVFAAEFYRRNIFLFLTLIAFVGGFMRDVDHIFLATYFTSSPSFLSIPIIIWSIYITYFLQFNIRHIGIPENTFLSDFQLLPVGGQWFITFQTTFAQLSPCIAYGFFLATIGLRNQRYDSVIIITLALVLQLVVATYIFKQKLSRPDFEHRSGIITQWIWNNFVRPFTLICIESSIRRKPLQAIAFKVAGMALIHITLYLYQTDEYDMRLGALGVVFAFALNVAFVVSLHEFITRHFPMFRQMPFSGLQRWAHIVFILAAFTLPELVILLRNTPDPISLTEALLLYCFGLFSNMLMLSFLFTRRTTPEELMPGLYVFIIFSFFVVLARIPIPVLTLLYAATSLVILRRFYYWYEPPELN